ncbi:MAG: VCBS repeat-containing protein [Bacteroidales bacterium]|nr:MAG: VCBS repeat-containing protein [Bacteroidales bacterium]
MKSKLLILSFLCGLAFPSGKEILAQSFTKVEIGPHVTDGGESEGCAWGDFDNDGDMDLFVANGQLSRKINFLFINQGADNDYTFKQVTEGIILEDIAVSRAASWGDYDNDGNLDMYVANQLGNNYNYLYQNNGDTTFSRMTEGEVAYNNEQSEAAGWFDYDNDGYLDIFVGCPGIANNLYHNNGDGTFTEITDDTLAKDVDTRTFGWCDFDNDGDYDILIEYASNVGALFLNNGKGSFTKINEGMVINNPNHPLYGGNWVDYDNDGDWDLVKVGRSIFRNEGPDSSYMFTKITSDPIVAEIGASLFSSWADIDNDGDIDCFIGFHGGKNRLFSNNGDGSFTQITSGTIVEEDPSDYTGCAWADYDNDGDMDIYVCNTGDSRNNLFYCNENINGNNWIKIKLIGTASNASAIGAVIKVKANTGASPVWQMRAIEGQSSFMGQNSMIAHFGLGTASIIDSLIVIWPAGHDTVLTGVTVNHLLTITEQMPERYLRAMFDADTTYGMDELSVQFIDKSLFDPDNPITSWSWDFDGDGTEDSNEQNPEYTFNNAEGEQYNILLVISNGTDTDTLLRTGLIKVIPPNGNLALLGRTTASSEIDILFNPKKAIDDNTDSYWESARTDSEWMKIGFNSVYTIGKVVIQWESGYGSGYIIQTSMDDTQWDTVYCEDSGNGAQDTLLFTGIDAKYVKWEGFDRGTNGGYSIIEFEIYHSDGNEYPEVICLPTRFESNLINDRSVRIYPNPAGNQIKIEFNQEINENATINLIDLAGKVVSSAIYKQSVPCIVTLNLSEFAEGMYFLKISTNKYVLVEKFVKTK